MQNSVCYGNKNEKFSCWKPPGKELRNRVCDISLLTSPNWFKLVPRDTVCPTQGVSCFTRTRVLNFCTKHFSAWSLQILFKIYPLGFFWLGHRVRCFTLTYIGKFFKNVLVRNDKVKTLEIWLLALSLGTSPRLIKLHS